MVPVVAMANDQISQVAIFADLHTHTFCIQFIIFHCVSIQKVLIENITIIRNYYHLIKPKEIATK